MRWPVPTQRIALCGSYAMRGTAVSYRAMRCPVLYQRVLLCACYAMSGTDVAYGATRSENLSMTGSYPLRDARY
eukprot:2795448-Rhodomonas_salina.2